MEKLSNQISRSLEDAKLTLKACASHHQVDISQFVEILILSFINILSFQMQLLEMDLDQCGLQSTHLRICLQLKDRTIRSKFTKICKNSMLSMLDSKLNKYLVEFYWVSKAKISLHSMTGRLKFSSEESMSNHLLKTYFGAKTDNKSSQLLKKITISSNSTVIKQLLISHQKSHPIQLRKQRQMMMTMVSKMLSNSQTNFKM